MNTMKQETKLQPPKLPKLMACINKNSLDNMRNRMLFNEKFMDSKNVRRGKMPLHECLIIELREAGYIESSDYLRDLIYDNVVLVKEDEIGIVTDLRKKNEYLLHIAAQLQFAEKERDRANAQLESLVFRNCAMHYAELEKGILWLAEKMFQTAIAVSKKFVVDGGRLHACCNFFFGKFLLDKFPVSDHEEAFQILMDVRDSCIGRKWFLWEPHDENQNANSDTLIYAVSIQLHRVLLVQSRALRKVNISKAERLARLAERRAIDADEASRIAEAVIDVGICQLIMNNLNNALKSFEKALKIHTAADNVDGICETKMHMAAVMQKLGSHEIAVELLTDMGTLAMQNALMRQLGRALHLLGELYLRQERPEMGTQHLREAFMCFMGMFKILASISSTATDVISMHEVGLRKISYHEDAVQDAMPESDYYDHKREMYEEEAEQSRLMMAISAGQQLMASYFNLIRKADVCRIARIKTTEWKLAKLSWWVDRYHHNIIPCSCPKHQRTTMDVIKWQLEERQAAKERAVLEEEQGISHMKELSRVNLHDLNHSDQSTRIGKTNNT